MTEAQARKAISMLACKQLHGSIVAYRSEVAIECQFGCFWRITSFSQWLKAEPTWRERIDLIQAELARLQAREGEAINEE